MKTLIIAEAGVSYKGFMALSEKLNIIIEVYVDSIGCILVAL